MSMLYWAAIPLETVFEGYDTLTLNWIETEYRGVRMVVDPIGNGNARVVRLLSALPKDYLNESISPGSIVPLLIF